MFAYNYFVWHSKMGISVMKMPKAVMMDFKMYFSRRNIDLHSKERHIWNSYELCGMHSVNSDMKKVKSCAHHYSDINWIELNCLNFSLNKLIQLSYYGYYSCSFLQRLFWKLIIGYFPMKTSIWHTLSPWIPLHDS